MLDAEDSGLVMRQTDIMTESSSLILDNRVFPYDLFVPTKKEPKISNWFWCGKREILTESELTF